MENAKINILLVGQGAVVSALARSLNKSPRIGKIFAAPFACLESEFFESVDIREDDLTGLLKFVLENEIGLTIPVTPKAFKSDIVSFFQENGQSVFGSSAQTSKFTYNNVYAKKLLYKIHAQTSKFGVFDKLQAAEEYLKSANFPVTIKCSEYDNLEDRLVCPTMSLASEFLNVLYSKNESSVLIEDFVYGTNFTIYWLTDGYSAVPITSVRNYKFMEDGDGGLLTPGMGCFTPDYQVSEVVISRVGNVVSNILTSLEKKGTPYLGILGVDCTMTGEDKFFINEFKPFFNDCDASAVLNILDEDLLELFTACVNGIFADEWENLRLKNLSCASALVYSKFHNKLISGLNNIDNENVDYINVTRTNDGMILTQKSPSFVITEYASTPRRAKTLLYEDLSLIHFDGIKYRKDILGSSSEF